MSQDYAVQRAAGVILWHLRDGGTEEEAVARAAEREPELTEAELLAARRYAAAHELAVKAANEEAKKVLEWIRSNKGAEFDCDNPPCKLRTGAEILRDCGIDCE